jgi:hypothetical protein
MPTDLRTRPAPARPALRAHPAIRAAVPPGEPWPAAWRGFLLGFLAGVLPALVTTRVLRSTLPLAATVLRGGTAFGVVLLLTTCVALATAVCFAARAAYDAA